MPERFLVTGASGCLGSWTIAVLLQEGTAVTALDLSPDRYRLAYHIPDDQLEALDWIQADITHRDLLEQVIGDHQITHVIHLAALQIPFCQADPALGARVNVVGTVNVFEAVRQSSGRVRQIVYASSAAVYGLPAVYPPGPVPESAEARPGTHYGVYKLANEGTARIYWDSDRIASVGLRPYIVYGVGRDQGLTSSSTMAMMAAAAGQPYRISYGGAGAYHHAEDVAHTLIACARGPVDGAHVYNLPGHSATVAEIIAAIEAAEPSSAGQIGYDNEKLLPFPEQLDASRLKARLGSPPNRPLASGVRQTVASFRELVSRGKLDPDRWLTIDS